MIPRPGLPGNGPTRAGRDCYNISMSRSRTSPSTLPRFSVACRTAVFAAILVGAHALAASAETYEIGPQDDLFAVLADLAPGDEVLVAEGTYQTPGFYEVAWNGTAEAPIVVRAADGARPIIQGDPSQNVINLDGAHFTLRGFEIVGGSHGLRLGDVSDAVFEDLVIHDVEDVALSCNRPEHACDSLVVRGNEIYNTGRSGTGEGMYLGCNDAACSFSNSLIEGNYLHDLAGSQADGIELKTGAHGNIVRDNVIIGANYPAITMYGFADGAGAENLVERNFVWGTVDNGIQVVGQVVVRNNIVVDAGQNGIHSKPSQGFAPHDVLIVHNTVLNAGAACLKTNDWSGESGQIVANNALFCDDGLAVDINGGAPEAIFAGNLAAGEVRGPDGFGVSEGVASELVDPAQLGLYPIAASALLDTGDVTYAGADDFNGNARSDGAPDIGAYERTAEDNPGWTLQEGFKTDTPLIEPLPDDDAGCGCRISPTRSSGESGPLGAGWPILALGLGALLWTRRRAE